VPIRKLRVLTYESGIASYREGSKKHLDNPVPIGDFLVLHCLGIRSSVSGIGSDHIGKYMSKY
jgi:hypothetical protein